MDRQPLDRRRFLRDGSLLVACAATGGALGGARAEEAPPAGADTARPAAPVDVRVLDPTQALGYNPKMGYRRLGKTEFLISEIALGGHGAPAYDEASVKNREAVLERASALGMNYLDTNISEECELYGKAIGSRRKDWMIGFADWPVKLTSEFEDQVSKEVLAREIDGRLRAYRTDMLDLWRPVGATWGEGQTEIPKMLMVSHRVLDMVVEVFEKARKDGKVRWLGISAHNPKVFRRVLEEYPQFSVIIFPYLFLTKDLGGDSLLQLAKEKDVGVIGLKPFAAGTTFGLRPRQIEGRVDPRAHVLLREMLREPRVASVIPGVNIPEQLDENVRGSGPEAEPSSPKDRQALRECIQSYHACVTPEYSWLRHWEYL